MRILLATVLVALVCVQSDGTFLGVRNGYKQIEEHLKRNGGDRYNQPHNVAVATKWLAELEITGEGSSDLLQALRQFTSLPSTDCDEASRKNLNANKLGMVRYRPMVGIYVSERFIEETLEHYQEIYDHKCRAIVSQEVAGVLAKMDQVKFGYLKRFGMGATLGVYHVLVKKPSRGIYMAPLNPMSWIDPGLEFSPFTYFQAKEFCHLVTITKRLKTLDVDFLLPALRALAEDDPNRKFLYKSKDESKADYAVRKEKVEGLYNHYLQEPCQEFVKTVETTIKKARADGLGSKLNIFDIRVADEFRSVMDFYVANNLYTLCKRIPPATKAASQIARDVIVEKDSPQ